METAHYNSKFFHIVSFLSWSTFNFLLNIFSRKSSFFVLMLFLMLGLNSRTYAEDEIHGSAQLSYRSTETKTGGKKQASQQFIQVYTMGLTKTLTPKVNFFADLAINVTDEDDKRTTLFSPKLRLNVNNEYFDAETGYRLTEKGLDILGMRSDENRYTDELWNIHLITKSEKYPKLRLRYSEGRSYDYLDKHQTDSKATNFSGDADYRWRFFGFNYGYKKNVTDNYVSESTQKTDTHNGRINFYKSFWENKITTTGSYVISHSKTKTTTHRQDVSVDEKQRAYHGLYARDTTPTVGALDNTYDILIDGDKGTSSGIDIGGSGSTYQNIGLDLNYQTEIEEIRLYTTDVSFTASNFSWAVYYSNDNLNWTLITNSANFVYDSEENIFTILFARTKARYFKVVNTSNDFVAEIYVTEVEAYSTTTYPAFTTTTRESITENIQFSVGYKPAGWCRFNYNFLLDQHQTKPSSHMTRRQNHDFSARVEKEVHKYLLTWVEYRRHWNIDSETEDKITDSYLVHFHSSPLHTFTSDLSLQYTEVMEGESVSSRTSSALLQMTANIREGADLNIVGRTTRAESLVSHSVTDTHTLDSTLSLELTRLLTAEITYNRQWTMTRQHDAKTIGQSSTAKTILRWRPSHEFNLTGTYAINRDELTGSEATQQQYNMNWLISKKMQIGMSYSIDRCDTVKYTYSFDLSWNLSRTFSLSCAYDWTRLEADTVTEKQTVNTVFSARF